MAETVPPVPVEVNANLNFNLNLTFKNPLQIVIRTVHRLAAFNWKESKPRKIEEENSNG